VNYKLVYEQLMHRARIRRPLSRRRYERHHIKPKCLGGGNKKSNLVDLTPEEHYVAHQLLVKIYPGHKGLLWAAFAMTGTGNGVGNGRHGNKLYGWLKRQFIEGQAGKPRWDDDTKRRIGEKSRERNCGEKHPMFGRHHSKAARQLQSKRQKERYARERLLGPIIRTFSPEHRQNLSEGRRRFLAESGEIPFKGCKHSKKTKHQMRETRRLRKEFFIANGIVTGSGGHPLDPNDQKRWREWIKSGNKYEPMAPELKEAA
jgi:hypothetical protein